MTNMRTWRSEDGRALECTRVLLGTKGLRALGRSVWAPPEAPAFTVSYRVMVNDRGVIARLAITTASEDRERTLTLNHTEDSYWLLDTGSGGSRTEFAGALDVDLEHSPLFNALPIRRLGLHRTPAEELLPVVFVSVPTLEVRLVEQRYATKSPVDADGRAVVDFRWADFAAELVVDADGLVLDYPGLMTRT